MQVPKNAIGITSWAELGMYMYLELISMSFDIHIEKSNTIMREVFLEHTNLDAANNNRLNNLFGYYQENVVRKA